MCAERPAGDAKSNSKKRTPLSFGCTHAESRMVINPSVYDFVRTREAHRNSATTLVVLTTRLRRYMVVPLCILSLEQFQDSFNLLQMVMEENI